MKAAGNTLVTSDMAKGFLDIGIVLSEGFNKGIQGLSKGVSSILKGNVFTDIESSISDKLYGAFEKINLGNKFQGILDGLFGNISIFDGFGNKLATSLSNSIGKAFSFAFSQTSMGKFLKPITDALNVDGLFEGKKLDNQIDSRNENINAIKSEINGLKNQKQAIEDILPSYEKLTQKTKLSASESQQLAEMRNQLADSNPDLVLGYDQNGTPILKNLQLQNKQLESQIKLKQQSQRLEENSLALDTLQRQTLGQKEFNKAYKEYNDMQLASDTKRKEGLFGKESMQDYAKRVIDDNKKITEANQKAYEQRLKDHQQYVQDEQAIQQKYMNEMTQKSSFNRLSDEMKSGMLTFMDALDWSQFSPAEGSQFAGMLANLGDKLVPTTEAMGKQSKAIAQLTQDYANGKTNLIDYTKGLTEQYEAAGKFDTESFTAWRQGLQSYVDTTGDLQGANKAINEMATSLNKLTGIKTDTWKTALSFDPAPIDASNKALQKFLNSYGTGVQNLGKGGMADKLTSQFETLQNSYTQMTSDLASGKEIDVEYLVNAKVNQPEPIANLIDEIVSDNEVTEQEIDLLLTAQAEILNTGEISDETIKQIAEAFEMTEEEVRIALNVKTDIKNTEGIEKVNSLWENIKDKTVSLTTKLIGKENIEKIKGVWENLKNKTAELTTKVIGKENIEKIKGIWENLKNKTIELVTKVKDFDFKEAFGNLKNKVIELTVKLIGQENIEKLKEAWANFKNKTVELITKIQNFDLIETLKSTWENIKTKTIELTTKLIGQENIEKLKEAWANFENKIVTLTTKVTEEILPKVKETWDSFVDKIVSLTIEAKETAISNAKAIWDSFVDKVVSLTTEIVNSELVQEAKAIWDSFVDKTVGLTTEVKSEILSTAKEMWDSFVDKTVSITMEIIDQGIAEAKAAWDTFVNKTVSIICSVLNGSVVEDLKANWNSIVPKTVQLIASVVGSGTLVNLKSLWASIVTKSVQLIASVVGSGLVSSLKGLWNSIVSKAETLTAKVMGSGLVSSLKGLWNSIKTKTETLTAKVSGSGAVSSLKGLWGSIVSKTVTLTAKVVKVGSSIINGIKGIFSSVDVPIDVNPTFKNVPINYSPIKPITPMLTNTPLANIPVSFSATDDMSTVTTSDVSPINVPVSMSANNAFGGTLDKNKILPSLDFDISHIKNLEEALKRLGKQIDFLNEKSEAVFGQEKINLLQQQIPLLREQQKIQEQIAKNERAQNNELVYWLSQQGFAFDNLGNISNYNDKLLAMEQNVESLKKKYDSLNDASKKNETAIKNAKNAYDTANETLSKTKDYLGEYFDTNNKEITEASEKWWEYENQIREVEEAIREAANAQLEFKIDSTSDSIDLLDAKIKNMNGRDKIKYLEEQNNLYRIQQQLLNQLAEQMRRQLNTLNPLSEEYAELSSEITKLSTEWWKTEEAIKDTTSEIEELNRQMKLLSTEAKLEGLDELFTELQFQIDFIKEKSDYAWGTDKIDAMRDSIGLLNGQLDLQQQKINSINARLAIYQDSLKKYNFQFDARGNSTNYSEVLDSYKNSTQLEEIIDLYKEYKDAHEELQDQMIEYWKIENEIKDLQKEKLEITQDVEEEITKIIEKEYEKRKDEIEKYTDERIKLLEKEKQIYKDMRDEQEYQKSINEQTSEIEKINSLIATASRDTSIAGQKRLKELMEDLAEAQKELEEMTQDKIDDDYSNNIDDEIDRLEEEQDKLIASLDEKFSETNIAKMVAQAMSSGFIEINGEVKSLQDALIQSVNDSTEGYSVMADVVKNELVSNLNVALSTMQQIADINEKLGLQSFNVISATQAGITNVPTYASGNSRTVTIGDTIINVSGSVDDITLSKIEDMIKEENERMLKEITSGI